MSWRAAVPEARRRVSSASCPSSSGPGRCRPGCRVVTRGPPPRRRRRPPGRCERPPPGRLGVPCRASPAGCASPPSASARPTSSSARSSRSGEGIFPEELVAEFKKLPRPGAARAVRGRARGRRGRPRPAARGGVRVASTATPLAAASIAQVHAATPAHRRGGRGQGAAPVGRRASSTRTSRVMAWLAPVPRRPHPGRRAGQPAGARRAVRRDDHRGARLPPRGREHARRRPRRFAELGQRGYVVPRPHPELVTPRVLVMERLDGLRVRRRRRHARTPASTPRRSSAPG